MFFLFPYFTPKLFCFLCIRLLVCIWKFSNYFLVEFSFFILECPVFFFLHHLTMSRYLPRLPLFPNTFCLISSCMVGHFCPFVFIFASQHIPSCFSFLSTFSCYRNFFTCPSNLISFQYLYFCSVSLGEHWFHYRQVSSWHKLARLVQWCCLLGYLFRIYLAFRFLP